MKHLMFGWGMSDAEPSPPALYVSGVNIRHVRAAGGTHAPGSEPPLFTEYTDVLQVDLDVKIN